VSGKGTNAGAQYQAHVIASAYVHVITERPVPWFGPVSRMPTAVWGETLGPGDDVRMEFGTSFPPAEVQARHDMNAGAELTALVAAIRARSVDRGPMAVALLIDRKSSGRLKANVAQDLDRLRGGRDDRLGTEVATLLSDPANREALERLFVVPADFDEPHSHERVQAIDRLRARLVNGAQAEAAYDLLVSDALELSATEGRRDGPYLRGLLEGRGFSLRPLEKDEPWSNRLDWIKESLLEGRYDAVALYEVERLQQGLAATDVSPSIRSRTERLRAVALMRLERPAEAFASSQRAIAIEPSSVDVLVTGAHSAIAAGEAAIATGYADRAIDADPMNPKAWAAKAYAAHRVGASSPTPPSSVADSVDYRTILIQIARDQDDFSRILELTGTLISEPNLAPEIRFLRAHALSVIASAAGEVAAREQLLEAERQLSELIDEVRVGHPVVAPAYLVRSQVRRLLGRTADANLDMLEAERANEGDPDVVEQAAATRAAAGDFDGALRVLRVPLVDDVPVLLAIRAEVQVAKGLRAEARHDLDAAIAGLPLGEEHDAIYYRLAETALLLGDRALADSLRNRMSDDGRNGPSGTLVAADMAFVDGDVEAGTALYRATVGLDPSRRVPLLMRLALELLDHRLPIEALAVMDEVGLDALPEPALQPYATAGLQAQSLAAAQAAIDRLARTGPLPPWALAIAADIALWRDDPETAAAHLSTLEKGGGGTARVRLALARCLVELGREGEALRQARAALAAEPTPGERIQAAVYLKEFGEPEEAVDQAFRAFREDRRDPRIQRTFASLVMTSGLDIPKPETVAANTHVRLRRQDGSLREHTILAGQPIDPLSHEMSEADAATAGVLDRSVGDVIERDAGHWSGQRWTVEEILPATVHVAHEIMRTFADNFPGEPFFVVSIHIGDGEAPSDWSGLMAALGERQDRALEVLRLYHEQVLPLEFVATMLQVPVPELMIAASRDELARPLLVEWSDGPSQQASVTTATEAHTVVLTRSGLATAHRLGLLEKLAAQYEVVVPTSLVWQLRVEIAEATRAAASGRSTMSLAAYGPHIDDIPANDPRLTNAQAAAEESLAWVEAHARREPRPHRAVFEAGSTEEEVRDRIGPPSYDAMALAESGIGSLYADDLGLRRRSVGIGPRPPSFSSLTLLEALAAKGSIAPDERDHHLMDLTLGGFAFVRPTSGLLMEGLRRMPGLGAEGLQLAFGPLGGPLVSALEAAALGAQAVRAVAVAPIHVTGVDVVTEAVVRSMAKRWSQPVAARLVREQAERALALLQPIYMETVARTCTTLATEGLPTI
jgi:tetratricopeptide (TPR) repeat protein